AGEHLALFVSADDHEGLATPSNRGHDSRPRRIEHITKAVTCLGVGGKVPRTTVRRHTLMISTAAHVRQVRPVRNPGSRRSHRRSAPAFFLLNGAKPLSALPWTDEYREYTTHRRGGRRLRRDERAQGAAHDPRTDHTGRPARLQHLPAAALPGRHRHVEPWRHHLLPAFGA